MKKIFFFFGICLAICACSDSDDSIGWKMFPDSDKITSAIRTFNVETDTKIFEEGIYCENAIVMLVGKHDNANYGITTTEASLLTMLAYPKQNLSFPAGAVVDTLKLRLAVSSHVGNEELKLEVYEMTKKLTFGQKYPTNITVGEFCDLSKKWGEEIIDELAINQIDTMLVNKDISYVYVNLDKQIAKKLMTASYASETAFQDSIKGIYIKSSAGNTMLNVAAVDLILKYHVGEDNTTLIFPSNNEVKKVNVILHEDLTIQKEKTNVFSPAGFYAQIKIPVKEILDSICNDPTNKIYALNSAYLTIEAEVPAGADSLPLPNSLVLLPENEIIDFFKQNNLPDRKTSFFTNLASTTTTEKYTYTFDLIYYLQEKIKKFDSNETYIDEDFALTPVTPRYSSSSYALTEVKNDIKLTSLSFNKNLKLIVTYSEFYNNKK